MKLSEFDFVLPEELIAQKPVDKRDESRLMVLGKKDGNIEMKKFYNVLDYLNAGDVLVVNETKVLPARFEGFKEKTEGRLEIFLVKAISEKRWEILVKPGRKAKPGARFKMQNGAICHIIDYSDDGGRIAEFEYDGDFMKYIEANGDVPLPPYIDRETKEEDKERYQTVFAEKSGAVAAPTAGLHFTEELLEKIRQKGVKVEKVLLHVGIGTFRPVKAEIIEEHSMHKEYFEVSAATAEVINTAKKENKKIFAVGTTSVRALESATDDNGIINAKSGDTNIFIYPGYKYKMVDALITNFHLPKSSLLMLVSAFSSLENMKRCYQTAIENSFRFYSYGDAMLII